MNKPDLQRRIKNILKHKNIEKPEHVGAKQGLEKSLEILTSNQKDLSGLEKLDTTQARAIAKFAVDFNNRTSNGEFFIKLGEVITGKRKITQ